MRTEIVYEDKSIMVVRKPEGLAVHHPRVGIPDVVSDLKKQLVKVSEAGRSGPVRGEPYLGMVHRIDEPVEGLLVFAKDRKAAAALSRQLVEGTLNKHYYALLCGHPDCLEGDLVDYLHKEGNVSVVVTGREQEFPDAKIAKLHYRILGQVEEPVPLALADVNIETGRFHQIRAQFGHAGFPLLGDGKYGAKVSNVAVTGQAYLGVGLCAYSLEFVHPVSGKKMSFRVMPKNPAFSLFSMEQFGEDRKI